MFLLWRGLSHDQRPPDRPRILPGLPDQKGEQKFTCLCMYVGAIPQKSVLRKTFENSNHEDHSEVFARNRFSYKVSWLIFLVDHQWCDCFQKSIHLKGKNDKKRTKRKKKESWTDFSCFWLSLLTWRFLGPTRRSLSTILSISIFPSTIHGCPAVSFTATDLDIIKIANRSHFVNKLASTTGIIGHWRENGSKILGQTCTTVTQLLHKPRPASESRCCCQGDSAGDEGRWFCAAGTADFLRPAENLSAREW